MTKLYTIALAMLAFSTTATAQQTIKGKVAGLQQYEKAPYLKVVTLPEQFTPDLVSDNPLQAPAGNRNLEETVAIVRWDAQSYGCMPSRIWGNTEGNPVATWIYGTDETGAFPERGCGYSVRQNGAWNTAATRVESVRTGFPAASRLADGTEVVVSHVTGTNPYSLMVSRKAPGATSWTETTLANPPGSGSLWPQIATDGQNIHIIAITTPVANGGVVYQGINGHILYWRSTDGGATWDKNAAIIPGLDNSKFNLFSANSYTIDVNAGVVGVAVFPDWNDLMVFKSFDNGDNWESITVNDFPDALENYAAALNDSYTFDDIGYYDEDAPDSLAVFSSDGFGSLLIDDSGQAHLWFGRMYFVDNDPAAGSFYYPGINGLVYWDESSAAMSIITGALDYDGDGALNIGSITEIGPYYNSLSSFPTTGTDADGNIYLCYSALNELYRSDWGAEVDQFYRRLYLMKSTDNGATWGDPTEISVAPYVDEFLEPYLECVWPAVPRHIGDRVWVLYQQDGTPGTNQWGNNHSNMENGINFISVLPDSISTGILNPVEPDASLALSLSPNPASQVVQIAATLNGNNQGAVVSIFNVFGQEVARYKMPVGTGNQSISVPVVKLPNGSYSVRIQEGNRFSGKILVIQR